MEHCRSEESDYIERSTSTNVGEYARRALGAVAINDVCAACGRELDLPPPDREPATAGAMADSMSDAAVTSALPAMADRIGEQTTSPGLDVVLDGEDARSTDSRFAPVSGVRVVTVQSREQDIEVVVEVDGELRSARVRKFDPHPFLKRVLTSAGLGSSNGFVIPSNVAVDGIISAYLSARAAEEVVD